MSYPGAPWPQTAALRRGARRRALSAVQRVEDVRVALVDHVAFDLEGWRQLALLNRQVVVEDGELLDLLDLGVVGVGAVELILNQLPDRLLVRKRNKILGQTLFLGPRQDLLGVERDQRDRIRAPISVHHGVRDVA